MSFIRNRSRGFLRGARRDAVNQPEGHHWTAFDSETSLHVCREEILSAADDGLEILRPTRQHTVGFTGPPGDGDRSVVDLDQPATVAINVEAIGCGVSKAGLNPPCNASSMRSPMDWGILRSVHTTVWQQLCRRESERSTRETAQNDNATFLTLTENNRYW